MASHRPGPGAGAPGAAFQREREHARCRGAGVGAAAAARSSGTARAGDVHRDPRPGCGQWLVPASNRAGRRPDRGAGPRRSAAAQPPDVDHAHIGGHVSTPTRRLSYK